jgi:hypothetical protein
MECCNSDTVDGNEPDGETALVECLVLEFHDVISFVPSCNLFRDAYS